MKLFFDTSVLVPVFISDHVHHQASFALLEGASRRACFCSAHSLVEVFSSLTRMPRQYRTRPEEALLFLETVTNRVTSVALDADEYWSVLKGCGDLGVAGGAVYDALIAHCAVKIGADVLYTWNLQHFHRLGTDVAHRVRTP